jgi:hypothetical protein
MWRLLQAEIAYNRLLWRVLLGCSVPFMAVFALFGVEEMKKSQLGVMVFIWSLSVIFSVFYMMDLSKTRRSRFLSMAPLAPVKVSLARIFIFIGFWLILAVLFWGVHLIFHPAFFEWGTLFAFLSLSGIVLFTHSCYLMALDVRFWLVSRRMFKLSLGEILGVVIPALLMGFFIIMYLSQGIFAQKFGGPGKDFLSSVTGGVFFLTLGLTASFFDVVAFSRRRSYLG